MAINKRTLRTVVAKQAARVLIKDVRAIAELDFETRKDQFLREFDEHKVTQELAGGPTAFSQIPELASAGGNLFSFLGFNANEKPEQELRDFLDEKTTLGRTAAGVVKGDRVTFKTPVRFPTVADVDAAMQRRAPLEWVTRPFTQLISKRIPGLPNYLFRESPPLGTPPSRSGTAIQTHGKPLRKGSFEGVPYVGEILGVLKRLFASERSRR
jgi:hypothetical protein